VHESPPVRGPVDLSGSRITVVGGTGFIGARLVPELVSAGATVITASRAAGNQSGSAVAHVRCDLESGEGVDPALKGADIAYFLVHGMAGGDEFADRERRAANNFNAAAHRQGVGKVVYLGGLYPSRVILSDHLESRKQVGLMLVEGCGALAVRAGVVVGAGSASFEIIYGLCHRLPVMIAPKWLKSRCQPIGVDDAIRALAGAASLPGAREVDLAGPDILTYRRMLEITAEEMRGRAPLMVAVPVLSPELSAHWLRLITRVDMNVARSLVSSLRHDMIAERPLLTSELGIEPIAFRESVRIALGRLD
jgi:uncharacterized protein YbjT (DUF2867 family)